MLVLGNYVTSIEQTVEEKKILENYPARSRDARTPKVKKYHRLPVTVVFAADF